MSAFWSGRAYFVDWAGGTGLFYSFDAGLLQVAQKLAGRPRAEQIYLTPAYAEHYTVLWALDGRPFASFDGRRVLVLPDSSRAASYGIITHEDAATRAALSHAFASSELPHQFLDAQGKPYAIVVTFPENARAEVKPQRALDIRAGDFASLVGADVEPATPKRGDTVRVRLDWNAKKAAQENFTVFVHLVGPHNPATNSPLWAQDDKQPGGGTYPTTRWQAGERIIEEYTFKLPPEALRGVYKIQAGMYALKTGERVPLFENGTRLADDAVTLREFLLD